ncbi:hypothetical protein B0H10DRAFT_2227386 [Mycena sp. CBHHK59/15]|nr:hypothetical protein B0H10DRAFT_2227386 [Mycena sp. CBHHK59/15]
MQQGFCSGGKRVVGEEAYGRAKVLRLPSFGGGTHFSLSPTSASLPDFLPAVRSPCELVRLRASVAADIHHALSPPSHALTPPLFLYALPPPSVILPRANLSARADDSPTVERVNYCIAHTLARSKTKKNVHAAFAPRTYAAQHIPSASDYHAAASVQSGAESTCLQAPDRCELPPPRFPAISDSKPGFMPPVAHASRAVNARLAHTGRRPTRRENVFVRVQDQARGEAQGANSAVELDAKGVGPRETTPQLRSLIRLRTTGSESSRRLSRPPQLSYGCANAASRWPASLPQAPLCRRVADPTVPSHDHLARHRRRLVLCPANGQMPPSPASSPSLTPYLRPEVALVPTSHTSRACDYPLHLRVRLPRCIAVVIDAARLLQGRVHKQTRHTPPPALLTCPAHASRAMLARYHEPSSNRHGDSPPRARHVSPTSPFASRPKRRK